MTKPENEPAFPGAIIQTPDEVCGTKKSNGLTKRELFAAMAMQGMIGSDVVYRSLDSLDLKPDEAIPAMALSMADALIAQLAKGDGG